MALIFGAPDTVPAGKMERKASNLSSSGWYIVSHREHCGLSPRLVFPEKPSNSRCQVLDVAELLDHHQLIHLDRSWLTRTIDIVPSEVNQHDMFSTIFL